MICEILVGTIVGLLIIMWLKSRGEQYNSRKEKASAISSWWNSNANPSYAEYKKALPDTDVVEYNKVKSLAKSGGVSTESVENVIG